MIAMILFIMFILAVLAVMALILETPRQEPDDTDIRRCGECDNYEPKLCHGYCYKTDQSVKADYNACIDFKEKRK